MTADFVFPPSLWLLAGVVFTPFLSRRWRPWALLLFPLGAVLYIWQLPEGAVLEAAMLNTQLVLCRVDALSRVFGLIFSFIAFAGMIYGFHVRETAHQCAGLLYASGALGVAFAGDFFTLFVFWEMMAVASTYLIWARRTPSSRRAGTRYILYHVFGGGVLFSGILLYLNQTGGLAVTELAAASGPAVWLMLAGVAVNAAVLPLHTWLPDAYPRATVTGAVFLSAFTTKTAVYVLLRVFPGWEILLWLGVAMTLYGVLFAILSNDIRRILAYHIISQVGYMVAGAGLGTEMGVNGSAAHAFSHILYKALLFMGTGAVLYATGKSKLTELGGLHRSLKPVLIFYMIAAFSISGFPLFNGFVSKSMVVSAAGHAHQEAAMLLLLLASVGTFLSVGLKLPYFTWFGASRRIKITPVPKNMYLGMGLVGAVCFFHGVNPGHLYRLMPHTVHFQPYSIAHLVETTQILVLTFIVFWLLRKKLQPQAHTLLDLDWFYRRPAWMFRKMFVDIPASFYSRTDTWAKEAVSLLTVWVSNPLILFGSSAADYKPGRYRPAIQIMLGAVLIMAVIFTVIGWGTGDF